MKSAFVSYRRYSWFLLRCFIKASCHLALPYFSGEGAQSDQHDSLQPPTLTKHTHHLPVIPKLAKSSWSDAKANAWISRGRFISWQLRKLLLACKKTLISLTQLQIKHRNPYEEMELRSGRLTQCKLASISIFAFNKYPRAKWTKAIRHWQKNLQVIKRFPTMQCTVRMHVGRPALHYQKGFFFLLLFGPPRLLSHLSGCLLNNYSPLTSQRASLCHSE